MFNMVTTFYETKYGTKCVSKIEAEFLERREDRAKFVKEMEQVLGLDSSCINSTIILIRMFHKLPEVKAVLNQH